MGTSQAEQQGGGKAVLDGAVDLLRDRELVTRCQDGDSAAFEELYRRYNRRLFGFCLKRLRETHEAEDAAQEAFTKAWKALPNFAGDRRFYPWLTVIAGNVCTDALRRRSRVLTVQEVPTPRVDPSARDSDEALIERTDGAMAMTALGNLSERHQRVLILREGSGWSTRQLAEHEGLAEPAMETLLWRARQALKREFAALAESGGRLGVALGLVGAMLRRTVVRSTAKVVGRVPLLQHFAGSGTLVPSVLLTGGVLVGTAALVTGLSAPPPTVAASPSATQASSGSIEHGAGAGGGPGSGAGVGSRPGPSHAAAGRGLDAQGSSPRHHGQSRTSRSGSSGTGKTSGAGLAGAAGRGGTTATGVVKSAAGALGNTVSSAGSALGGVVGSASNTAGGIIGSVSGSAGNTISSATGGAGGVVGTAGSTAGSTVSSVGSGLGGTVGAAGSGVGSTIGGTLGSIGGTLGNPTGTPTGGAGSSGGTGSSGSGGSGSGSGSGGLGGLGLP